MPFFCEIDAENQTYEFKTIVSSELIQRNMAEWLREIVEMLRSVRETYQDIVRKDGRILGQERNFLVEHLDHLFTALLVLQRTMHENIPAGINKALELRPRVSVLFTLNNFSSQGSIREADLYSLGNFGEAFINRILPGIQKLLHLYRVMIEPGYQSRVVDFQEIFQVFDEMFYQLLILRFNLVNCVIDH